MVILFFNGKEEKIGPFLKVKQLKSIFYPRSQCYGREECLHKALRYFYYK
jgi:hypothetical protein